MLLRAFGANIGLAFAHNGNRHKQKINARFIRKNYANKWVVYLSDKYGESDSVQASKLMFKMTGVDFDKYELTGNTFTAEL